MQKRFCENCNKEIKVDSSEFSGKNGKISFDVKAKVDGPEENMSDICLPCVVNAITKEANKVTRSRFRKKASKKPKEDTVGIGAVVESETLPTLPPDEDE